jgi:hypothetical protein
VDGGVSSIYSVDKKGQSRIDDVFDPGFFYALIGHGPSSGFSFTSPVRGPYVWLCKLFQLPLQQLLSQAKDISFLFFFRFCTFFSPSFPPFTHPYAQAF